MVYRLLGIRLPGFLGGTALESLLDQDHDPARYVDNNSTDGTRRTRWQESFFSSGSLRTTPAA